jgi:hypothetical protein
VLYMAVIYPEQARLELTTAGSSGPVCVWGGRGGGGGGGASRGLLRSGGLCPAMYLPTCRRGVCISQRDRGRCAPPVTSGGTAAAAACTWCNRVQNSSPA